MGGDPSVFTYGSPHYIYMIYICIQLYRNYWDLSPYHVVDSEEAVVMAQWLEMITLKVASENPANTMRATLGKITRVTPQNNFSELF